MSVAQRSLSRARQFGKDLTNMFSFTRNNQSRQSSKGSASHAQQNAMISGSANQPPSVGRHKVISSGSLSGHGSLPKSARHNQQPAPTQFEYQTKNTAINGPSGSGSTHLPSAVGPSSNIRKSSLNPSGGLQKSLNSLDFQQHKSQGSAMSNSVGRPSSSLRSRDKLPTIGYQNKLMAYQKRIEDGVIQRVNKVDMTTLTNIYHVSMYCNDIQQHMQATEK